jgi:cytoplasmic iron level regulating protein YaaA (DUF328/UPF0246 family)
LKQSIAIDKVLKKQKPKNLMQLMDISEKLADLNWQRNQERNLSEINESNARQAVFAFNGEVYVGLDAYSLAETQIDKMQHQLRILSGLYGILKPLDLIQPYRLEMGTKLPIGSKKNLYEFWKSTVTSALNDELDKDDFLLNLASTEYASVIDFKKLKATVITPEFKDYKDGKLKMISFFAKKARGLMVRFLLDTQATTIEDLKLFNYEGYAFDANLSTPTKLVFTR